MFELNDETKFILGRPNFVCVTIARKLRLLGHIINEKVEDEQAAAIHWMLCLYEKYDDCWLEKAEKVLKGIKQVGKQIGKQLK